MERKKFESINEFGIETQKNQRLLVKWELDDCTACEMVEENVVAVNNEIEDLTVIKIEIGENFQLAKHFDAQSVPKFDYFENGVPMGSDRGVVDMVNLFKLVGVGN